MRLSSVITTCLLSALCIGGCGSPARQRSGEFDFPPSHRGAELRAAETALQRLGLPDGGGTAVNVEYGDPDAGDDLAGVIVPRFLMDNNYRVFTGRNDRPRFSFRLTTVGISLEADTRENSDMVRRTAEVAAKATHILEDGSRRVYESTGTYQDAFASHLLDSLDEGDPHVENHISDPIESRLKPVALGIAMTVMSWLLYSYRG